MVYISIPVPEERVTEVYAFLGKPQAETTPTTDEVVPEWTEAEIVRAYQESGDKMTAVLNHLADNPDVWLGVTTISAAIGIEHSKFRGVMGAFGHRVRSRYDGELWFFEYRWDTSEHTSYYKMPRAVADIINEIRR